VKLLAKLRPHRHEWTHGGTPVERIADIPEASLFYRLDCECGESIDGGALLVAVPAPAPKWLLRGLGFKEDGRNEEER